MKSLCISKNFTALLIGVGATITMASCSTDENTSAQDSVFVTKSNSTHTGEFLFRQIYFFEGEKDNMFYEIPVYQNLIEEVKLFDQKTLLERDLVENTIIDGIYKNYPEYFSRLETVVRDRDPQQISDFLLESEAVIVDVSTIQGLVSKAEDASKGLVIYPVFRTEPVFYPSPFIYALILGPGPLMPHVSGAGGGTVHQLVKDKVVEILAR